jgi:hypothetical protein
MLKITQEKVNTDDPLQKYIVKSNMIGGAKFKIDMQKRALTGAELSGDIDSLTLPPVEDINYSWYNNYANDNNFHINTMYFPDTLKRDVKIMDKSLIPMKSNSKYKKAGRAKFGQVYVEDFIRLVDKVVIPSNLNVMYVTGWAAARGIIYETKYGTGTADQIVLGSGNSGIALKVVEVIQHPNNRTVVIEDKDKNRKVVTENALITVVEDGKVHLTNAVVLFNRTVKIMENNK